jgi:transcriptional regulator with PAS, ATPase and Fis domain
MVYLVLYKDDEEIAKYEIDKNLIKIGRLPDNHICLSDRSVSGYHCELRFKDDQFVLKDLKSTNGTYVNQRKIKEVVLSFGDVITLGRLTFKFLKMKETPAFSSTRLIKEVEKIKGTIRSLPESAITQEVITLSQRLEKITDEMEQIKKIEAENIEKVKELQFEDLLKTCPSMQRIFSTINNVARTDVSILIEGETGTGKEMIARFLHKKSNRAKEPFIVINCGAIPENLLEAELFGYEKGAFTDAYTGKKGKFELANGGTIFLDEVGELPLNLQVKLLRVLQEREIERLGGREPIKVDLRVLAATNRVLKEEVRKGNFREDLFYRLSVLRIFIPPLRERKDDILLLARFYLHKYQQEYQKEVRDFSPAAKEMLLQHPWRGNIRELDNRIRRGVLMTHSTILTPSDLDFEEEEEMVWEEGEKLPPLREVREQIEKKHLAPYLKKLLAKYQHNLSLAAQAAEVDRKTLRTLITKCGIS